METVLKGRPLLFRKKLIILDHLKEPISRQKLKLLKTPYWIKAGPRSPKCERKDLMHVIGSSFGGLLSAKSKREFYRIKVMIKVHKPL